MASPGDVEFNDAEIQRILNSSEMAAEVTRACNIIVARARVLSPVKSTEYIESFRVQLKFHKKLRVVGYVINDAEHAMVVEMRYGVLSKAKGARG